MRFDTYAPSPARELLDLRARLGGQIGTLDVGGDKVVTLKLGDNVYATADTVKPQTKIMMGVEQADIHEVKSHSDLVYFAARYQNFTEEADGSKAER